MSTSGSTYATSPSFSPRANGRVRGGSLTFKKSSRLFNSCKSDLSSRDTHVVLKSKKDVRPEDFLQQKCLTPVTKSNTRYLADTDSMEYKLWQLLIVLCTCYVALVTPFEVAFLPSVIEWTPLFICNICIDMIFLIDVALSFNTPFYHCYTGLLVTSHWEIAKHYLKTWFLLDLVPAVPVEFIVFLVNRAQGTSNDVGNLRLLRILRVLKLLKILRMLKLSKLYRQWHDLIPLRHTTITLGKFVMLILLISHWIACLFRFIPELENLNAQNHLQFDDPQNYEGTKNWIDRYFVDSLGLQYGEFDTFAVYVACFYFAVMTLTTVGYGDVSAFTDIERLSVSLFMLLGAILYAYIVAAVCGIFSNLSEKNNEFFHQVDELNEFMRKERIPGHLRTKIQRYFGASDAQRDFAQYQTLVANLSSSLRQEISTFKNESYLSRSFLLRECHEADRQELLLSLSVKMKMRVYSPYECLIAENELIDEILVLKRGLVMLHRESRVQVDVDEIVMSQKDAGSGFVFHDDTLCQLYRDEVSIGMEGVLPEDIYASHYASCLTFCEVFVISREDFFEVFKQHQLPRSLMSIRSSIKGRLNVI